MKPVDFLVRSGYPMAEAEEIVAAARAAADRAEEAGRTYLASTGPVDWDACDVKGCIQVWRNRAFNAVIHGERPPMPRTPLVPQDQCPNKGKTLFCGPETDYNDRDCHRCHSGLEVLSDPQGGFLHP